MRVVEFLQILDPADGEVVATLRDGGFPEAVVLVPGILAWRGLAEVERLAEALAQTHDVLSIDVQGHGDALGRFTWGREEWRQVRAATSWLAARGRSASVIGFSFGGYHAARAASEGAVLDRLVLVSAPVDLHVLDHFPFGARWWRHVMPMLRRRRRRTRLEWPRRIGEARLEAGRLARIRARTLVVHCGGDWLIERRHAERYAREIPAARLVEIPRALHAEHALRSHPGPVLSVVRSFLEEGS